MATTFSTRLSGFRRGNIYWDLESGLEIRRLERIDAIPGASGLAFLPEGSSAISRENDGMVIQWDLETGKEFRRFWQT